MKLLGAFVIQFALTLSYPRVLFAQANQNQEKPAIVVPPAPPISGSGVERQSCPLLVDTAIPVNTTIEAKLGMLLESHRQKTGKKLWANSVYEMDLHECRMLVGAPVFGSVTAAASSKDPRHSELSLVFDSVDCVDHAKHPMKLVVIGVYAPPSEQVRAHNAVPTEINGIGRQISETVASTNGYDAILNPTSPRGVKPGMVVGYKDLILEPQGGPHCSSRLTSTNRNLVLVPGTILLLVPRQNE